MPAPFTRIGIVGLGLIGGSIALAVERRWPGTPAIGVDRADQLQGLRGRVPAIRIETCLEALAGTDFVVLAAPVRENLALIGQLPAILDRPALITDTSSTKRAIVQAAEALPAHLTFIGGHPMAGDVRSGAAAARADLFDDRPWLLTPSDAPSGHLHSLEAFVEGIGGRPSVVDAARHDRVMAYGSHLPQLVASALMHAVGQAVGAEGLALAGSGLVDTTRLAASAPAIWRDIAATNSDELRPAIDALIAALAELRADLGSGEAIEKVFTSAAGWRRRIMDGRE